jgi:hypothetical protein
LDQHFVPSPSKGRTIRFTPCASVTLVARRLDYDPSFAIAVAASTAHCFMLLIGSMSDAAILLLLAGRSISLLAVRLSQHTSQQRCRHSCHIPARILVSHFAFSVRILAAQTFHALRAERHTAETTYQCQSESAEFNLCLRYDMRISVIIFSPTENGPRRLRRTLVCSFSSIILDFDSIKTLGRE